MHAVLEEIRVGLLRSHATDLQIVSFRNDAQNIAHRRAITHENHSHKGVVEQAELLNQLKMFYRLARFV